MTTVVDASVVVAALVDTGSQGIWAESLLASGALAAPHVLPVEVASILRRTVAAGEVSADVAALAHADLLALRVELFPYRPLTARVGAARERHAVRRVVRRAGRVARRAVGNAGREAEPRGRSAMRLRPASSLLDTRG